MIKRSIEVQLQRLAAQFPVITITGPRQSGKTTLAQHYFKDYDYVNLEEPEIRAYAAEDPKGFLADHPAPLIIDEVQRVPSLLSYIQVIADRDRKAGQYVLTGSHQPKLKAEISQSDGYSLYSDFQHGVSALVYHRQILCQCERRLHLSSPLRKHLVCNGLQHFSGGYVGSIFPVCHKSCQRQ